LGKTRKQAVTRNINPVNLGLANNASHLLLNKKLIIAVGINAIKIREISFLCELKISRISFLKNITTEHNVAL